MAEEVNRFGPEVDPHVVATVEAIVLPQAVDLSIPKLRALVRAEFIRLDQEAADRRRKAAEATANVRLRTGDTADGMSQVVTTLPHPIAAAVSRTVDAIARALKAKGDARPIGQIRAEVLARLVLRPGDEGLPAVSVQTRILAPLRSLLCDPADPTAPGRPTGIAEIEGQPITAAHLRALLAAANAIGPDGLQAPTGGSLDFDVLGAGGELLATLNRRELERAARRGCPEHPNEDCACSLAGKPPPTDGYEATPRHRRFLLARDRTCREPG
jgi:hypothetical protein